MKPIRIYNKTDRRRLESLLPVPTRKLYWKLRRERSCENCGAVFPKGSSVSVFLTHVKLCNINSKMSKF